MHDLNGDLSSRLPLRRAMHLRQTRDADRDGVKRGEERREGRADVREEEGLQLREWGGTTLVLERFHRFGPGDRDELYGGEMLAELGERRRRAISERAIEGGDKRRTLM